MGRPFGVGFARPAGPAGAVVRSVRRPAVWPVPCSAMRGSWAGVTPGPVSAASAARACGPSAAPAVGAATSAGGKNSSAASSGGPVSAAQKSCRPGRPAPSGSLSANV
ncbi:hypothetical protein AB1484_19285 [Parafrankia sp. FMc6]|uniref:hypothetical protein n=1 Tax=Parafrankia soli TaxID=2599596 RepID=UPI0034D67091